MNADRHLSKRQAKMIQELGRSAREHGVDLSTPPPEPPDWTDALRWLALAAIAGASLAALYYVGTAAQGAAVTPTAKIGANGAHHSLPRASPRSGVGEGWG